MTTKVLVAASLAVSIAVLAPGEVSAQESEQQYETWLGVNAVGPVARDLLLQVDVQYRGWDDFSPHGAVARPGIGYRLVPGLVVAVGYAWVPSWQARDAVGFTDEHRAWEQLSYEAADAPTGIQLALRTRLEERFRHPATSVEVAWRLREMLRTSLPLSVERTFAFVLWDEIFFALSDGGHTLENGAPGGQWQFAGFDQNRLFIGIAYPVVPGVLRVEAGYMNQWVRRPGNAAGDLSNDIAAVYTYVGWR